MILHQIATTEERLYSRTQQNRSGGPRGVPPGPDEKCLAQLCVYVCVCACVVRLWVRVVPTLPATLEAERRHGTAGRPTLSVRFDSSYPHGRVICVVEINSISNPHIWTCCSRRAVFRQVTHAHAHGTATACTVGWV
jgi:hypothetical protein